MGYMKEFGRAGQKRTGGIFYEEFLPELQGKKGIETCKLYNNGSNRAESGYSNSNVLLPRNS